MACGHVDTEGGIPLVDFRGLLPSPVDVGNPARGSDLHEQCSADSTDIEDIATVTDRDPKEALPESFVEDNLPMVRFIAWRIHELLPRGMPIDDLVSAGLVGLMDAHLKYDSHRGVKFSTYAQFRIRGAILDSLRDLDLGPRHLRSKAREIEGRIHVLSQQFGRVPESHEIAESLGMSLSGYHKLVAQLGTLSGAAGAELPMDDDERTVESLPADPSDNPLEHCLQQDLRQHLGCAMAQLPGRERLVVSLYYYEEMSAKEIAECLGVAQSRIWQIRHAALAKLRARIAPEATGARKK